MCPICCSAAVLQFPHCWCWLAHTLAVTATPHRNVATPPPPDRETQTQDIFIINRMRLVRAASVGYNGAFIEVVTIIVSTLKTLFFVTRLAEWHHHHQAPPAVLVSSYILDLPQLASKIICKLDFGRSSFYISLWLSIADIL